MIDFRPKVILANQKYELENNSDFDDGIPFKELDDLQQQYTKNKKNKNEDLSILQQKITEIDEETQKEFFSQTFHPNEKTVKLIVKLGYDPSYVLDCLN